MVPIFHETTALVVQVICGLLCMSVVGATWLCERMLTAGRFEPFREFLLASMRVEVLASSSSGPAGPSGPPVIGWETCPVPVVDPRRHPPSSLFSDL